MNAKVLIVDDIELERDILQTFLSAAGYKCLVAGNGEEALTILAANRVDIILSDHYMPEMDGFELLNHVKKLYPTIPFVMLTAQGSIGEAVRSIKVGAEDYILKPYDSDAIISTVKRCLSISRLTQENRNLKDELRDSHGFSRIVSKSHAMQEALSMAMRVAAAPNTTVAIFGESGTGKEVLARAIHTFGASVGFRFIAINCAGIPENLLESELFGYSKGAFTGADREKEGRFDAARNGTILLDEIGDMPLQMQARLLRVLQERVYERIGSTKSIAADFRIIVATHRNLKEMVEKGTFREDLYHRITTFPIQLPALRERREDIVLLAESFLSEFRKQFGKKLSGFSDTALEKLMNYDWPGNVRELKNCIERAAIISDSEIIRPEHLGFQEMKSGADETAPAESGIIQFDFSVPEGEASLDNLTDIVKKRVLTYCANNKQKAAKMLGRDRNVFYR